MKKLIKFAQNQKGIRKKPLPEKKAPTLIPSLHPQKFQGLCQ